MRLIASCAIKIPRWNSNTIQHQLLQKPPSSPRCGALRHVFIAVMIHAQLAYMARLVPAFFSMLALFAILSVLSLYRSENRSKCGRITIEYFTNSSMQSTRRSRFPLGISLLSPSFKLSASVNCLYAIGIELWFGVVNMRIHLPRIRSEFTTLKDWEPPLTWAIASVRPCVGRTEPVDKGIQSIWFLNTAVCTRISYFEYSVQLAHRRRPTRFPCCSGDTHTCPSLHRLKPRSSWTLGWECCASSLTGKPAGLKTRTSHPSLKRTRAASKATSLE